MLREGLATRFRESFTGESRSFPWVLTLREACEAFFLIPDEKRESREETPYWKGLRKCLTSFTPRRNLARIKALAREGFSMSLPDGLTYTLDPFGCGRADDPPR